MSVGTPNAEGDWATPATRAEVMVLKVDLESKIDRFAADLGGKVKDVRVELGDLGGKIKDVRVELAELGRDLSGEISKLRVSMAWMTVGVITVLGGLITLFEFLS